MPNIPGASEASFTPQFEHVGKRIRIRERAIGPNGVSEWVYSDWSDPVAPPRLEFRENRSMHSLGYIPLDGLTPGATYRFRVRATDSLGKATTSEWHTFTTASSQIRPYFQEADWLWEPIPESPALDSESASIAQALATRGTHICALRDYAVTLVEPGLVDCDTPRWDIHFKKEPAWGSDPFCSESMPIPPGTAIPPGTDGHVAVADPYRNLTFNLWQAEITPGGEWRASWGALSRLNGDGRELGMGSSTGSGLARYGGVIRASEVMAGEIPHALFFISNMVRPTEFRYPATRTDGANIARSPVTIPEGARVQLDPTIDLDSIRGITPGEKMIGRALQRYGAYCGDNSGAFPAMGFIFEHIADGLAPGGVYQRAGLTRDSFDMTHIPWGRLRVLKSWDGR